MASVELFLQRYCYNSLQIFLSTRCTNNQNSLMPLGLALFPGSAQLFIVYSTGKNIASDGKLGGSWKRCYIRLVHINFVMHNMVVYTRNFSIHFEQLSFLYNLGLLPSTVLFTSLQRHELSVAFKEQPLINTCEIPLCVCCKVRSCVCEKRSSHYFVAILSNELPACVNIRDLLLWQWLPSNSGLFIIRKCEISKL